MLVDTKTHLWDKDRFNKLLPKMSQKCRTVRGFRFWNLPVSCFLTGYCLVYCQQSSLTPQKPRQLLKSKVSSLQSPAQPHWIDNSYFVLASLNVKEKYQSVKPCRSRVSIFHSALEVGIATFRKPYKQPRLMWDFQLHELIKGTERDQHVVSACCGFCPVWGDVQLHSLIQCCNSTYPSYTFHFMESPYKPLTLKGGLDVPFLEYLKFILRRN